MSLIALALYGCGAPTSATGEIAFDSADESGWIIGTTGGNGTTDNPDSTPWDDTDDTDDTAGPATDDERAPSQDPPGGLAPEQVPMFVTLGFDDNGYSGCPAPRAKAE